MTRTALSVRLRQLRNEHEYTQAFIGVYLNMTRQAYSHYETGKRTPDYNTLFKLSQLYCTNIENLLKDTEADEQEDHTIPKRYENITKKEQKLLILFAQLSAQEQDEFIEFLNTKVKMSAKQK